MNINKTGNKISIGKSKHPDLQPIKPTLRKSPFNVKIGKNIRRMNHFRNHRTTTWGDFFNTK